MSSRSQRMDKYDQVGDFNDDDIALARIGDKYGYINYAGENITEICYEDPGFGKMGKLLRIKHEGMYGYVNSSGRIVVPIQFTEARHYSAYCDIVVYNSKCGLLNDNGDIISLWDEIDCLNSTWPCTADFHNENHHCGVNKQRLFCDNVKADIIGHPACMELPQWIPKDVFNTNDAVSWLNSILDYKDLPILLSAKICAATTDTYKYDLVDRMLTESNIIMDHERERQLFRVRNRLLLEAIYPHECQKLRYSLQNYIRKESSLARVLNEGKWGCINATGEIVIPIEFDEIENEMYFHISGVVIVKKGGRYALFDGEGNNLTQFVFDKIHSFNSGEFAIVAQHGKSGFVDSGGELIGQCKYDRVYKFNDVADNLSLSVVVLNKKYGCINQKGEEVIPLRFSKLTTFYYNPDTKKIFAKAKLGAQNGVIDIHGKFTATDKYIPLDLLRMFHYDWNYPAE